MGISVEWPAHLLLEGGGVVSVTDEPSSFNAILRCTWIHAMKTLPSSYHQMLNTLILISKKISRPIKLVMWSNNDKKMGHPNRNDSSRSA